MSTTFEQYKALALREWNLARSPWKPFLRYEQLGLGEQLWVVERTFVLMGC